MTSLLYSLNRGVFNGEFFQTRALNGDDVESSIFTPTEAKLITLGLNSAAHPGEVDACATKLFHSLRKRGISADDFMRRSAQAIWEARELAAARGRIMTFGKHQGRTVGELPRGYIIWALKDCTNMPYNLRRAMEIVLAHACKP